MADSGNKESDTGLSAGNDIPPWLQAVPEGEASGSHVTGNKMLIAAIAGAVIVIALFVSVLFYFYENSVPEAPIVVAAPKTAIKEKPADPGGMTVEHQDKTIFDQSDGLKPRGDVTLGEQPETPVSEIIDDPLGDVIEAATAEQASDTQSQTVAVEPKVIEAPVSDAVEAAVPEPQEAAADVGAGTQNIYRIQLGAYASETSAGRAWRAVRARGLSALANKSAEYEAVQSGDRTLYRLRVGPYPDRIAADQACLALRAVEQACIVVNP